MKTFDLEISYMGSTFTVGDVYEHMNGREVEYNKIGGLTYLTAHIERIMNSFGRYDSGQGFPFSESDVYTQSWYEDFWFFNDVLSFDHFMSNGYIYNRETLLPFTLMYLDFFKIEDIDDDLTYDLFLADNEEQLSSAAYQLASKYFE